MGLVNNPIHPFDENDSSASTTDAETYSSTAIGITLRKIRKQSGLASSDLALEAEVHPSYYSLLENGHNHISVKKLSSICQVHDMSLSYFFSIVEAEQEELRKKAKNKNNKN